MKTAFAVTLGAMVLFAAWTRAQEPAPLPAVDTNPWRTQIAQLQDQLLARDNEILHLRTEWATCRASLDAADLTTQAIDLVRRCEAATGAKCTWDDKQRRVVKIDAPKEQ